MAAVKVTKRWAHGWLANQDHEIIAVSARYAGKYMLEENGVPEALDTLDRRGAYVGIRKTYEYLLQWCGNQKQIEKGRLVHDHILKNGYGSNVYLGNLVLRMYRKCGSFTSTKNWFDAMPKRDSSTWNTMIGAYLEGGCCQAALNLYKTMRAQNVDDDRYTFVSILNACSRLEALDDGKAIHERMQQLGIILDIHLEIALCNMYGKCGQLRKARKIFDRIPKRNVIAYTVMITAYAQHGKFEDAVDIYEKMIFHNVEPSMVSYISILGACTFPKALDTGKKIHARIIESKMDVHTRVCNALALMYARCGSIDEAKKVFDEMQVKDVCSWTQMINAYVQNGQGKEAIEMYHRIEVEPNCATFVSALGACSSLGNLEEGKAIHERMIASGFKLGVVVSTALVGMYTNCGRLDEARKVFENMKLRNVVTWNVMIGAYASYGDGREAFKLFRRMQLEGTETSNVTFISLLGACSSLGDACEGRKIHSRILQHGMIPGDEVLECALVNMYGKCHLANEAKQVFEKMKNKDVVAWSAAIAAVAQQEEGNCGEEAMRYLDRMEAQLLEPNSITFVSLLNAFKSPQDLAAGKQAHARIAKAGPIAMIVQNALVNMYAKCGSPDDARKVFEAMEQKELITWNAMLAAYLQYGDGMQAIEMYKRMREEGMQCDDTTLVTLICVCSTRGCLEQGRKIHEDLMQLQIPSDVATENALVNMYGKCGSLQEARSVFDSMENRNLVSWTAMVVAYAQHGHGREALELCKKMHLDGIEPDTIALNSIVIACSHSGLVELGRDWFVALTSDSGVAPNLEHYVCLIDLLSRAGWLKEAEELLNNMPFEPEPLAWMTLLGGCKLYGDIDRAKRIGDSALELDPGSHVLLSNIYMRRR